MDSSTTTPVPRTTEPAAAGFRHEALFYRGEEEFLRRATTFVRDGLAAGAPVLVVVDAPKVDRLRAALGADSAAVGFAAMDDVGANPGRIIPAWQEFLDGHAGAEHLRGIGEPISPRRSGAELEECHRHEALLNVAFEDAGDFELLCPYDTSALAADVVARARHTHPVLGEDGRHAPSDPYRPEAIADAFAGPLPDPPPSAERFAFDRGSLSAIRAFVVERAQDHRLERRAAGDFVTAVNEIATNSLRHGGGSGHLRLWSEDRTLVCEVADRGTIDDPLVGRRRPDPRRAGGFGHWIANQLCDLVQVRSSAGGTVVRLHLRRR
jgi:anti-sigma regulatory factor (Ser/Thr protein kinase)